MTERPVPATAVSTRPAGTPAGGPGPELLRGDIVDKYVILERLGAGGMGVVLSAYDPSLDRRVALKLVRPAGSGTSPAETEAAEVRRGALWREAQAMARLTHPNVVTVYASGAVGDSLYVAMELVTGGTLRDWLAAEPRSREAIVEVFRQAGAGLAAAHRAGIVHRDFKPDNVLVGADGRARVTDFGVAAMVRATPAVTGAAADDVPSADPGRAGTPAYMAPEQREEGRADALSDQYSFCASLHEALFGSLPPERARRARVPAVVEAVLARGLAVDPSRRFATMDALLGELARDPAARRRHAALGVGAAALVATVVGLLLLRAGPPCTGAERRFRDFWGPEARAASRAAFGSAGGEAGGRAWERFAAAMDDYTEAWRTAVVEACEATHVQRVQSEVLLDARVGCLERRLDGARAVAALYRAPRDGALADAPLAVYRLPGLDDCRAGAVLAQRVPPPAPSLAGAAEQLRRQLTDAEALGYAGRYREAGELADTALARARALGYAPLEATALFIAGWLTGFNGEPRAARDLLRGAVTVAKASHNDEAEADAWSELVWVLGKELVQYDEALVVADVAEAAVTALGDGGRRAALVENNRAEVLIAQGRFDEARVHHHKALELRRRALGPEHPDVGKTYNNLAGLSYQLERYEEAGSLYERALTVFEKALGPDHPLVGRAAGNLGEALRAAGRVTEAEARFEQALRVQRATLGTDHVSVGLVHTNLGLLLRGRGELARARQHFEEALRILDARRPVDHPQTTFALLGLGDTLVDQGRPAQALPLIERAVQVRAASLGPVDRAEAELALARALVALGPVQVARARRLVDDATARLDDKAESVSLRELAADLRKKLAGEPQLRRP